MSKIFKTLFSMFKKVIFVWGIISLGITIWLVFYYSVGEKYSTYGLIHQPATDVISVSKQIKADKQSAIMPTPCDPKYIKPIDSLVSRGSYNLDRNETYPLFKDVSCQEYKVNDDNSVLIQSYSGHRVIILSRNGVYEDGHKERTIYRLLEDDSDYPGWTFTLDRVSTDGKIYFEYGGWDYLTIFPFFEKSGTEKYVFTIE